METLQCSALQPVGRERVGENAIFDTDEGKLLFTVNADLTAKKTAEIMAEKFKIQPETAIGKHILLMTSVADSEEGFVRLENAVKSINADYPAAVRQHTQKHDECLTASIPEMVLTPREAMHSEHELVPASEAVNRISAELIANYPPGTAIIAPGERIPVNVKINQSHIRVVKLAKKNK
jgi:arginine/lysine/ornithine decarboxylase